MIPIVYPFCLVGTWHHIWMAPSRQLPIPGSWRQGCVHRQLEKTVQFERKVAQRYRPPWAASKREIIEAKWAMAENSYVK